MTKAQRKLSPILELNALYRLLAKLEEKHDVLVARAARQVADEIEAGVEDPFPADRRYAIPRKRMVKKALSVFNQIRKVEKAIYPLGA